MGLSSDVNNLIEDCRTGQLLVEVVEKLAPNLVNWKMVKKDTKCVCVAEKLAPNLVNWKMVKKDTK
eukprot:1162120-Rhodomonas_salina.1